MYKVESESVHMIKWYIDFLVNKLCSESPVYAYANASEMLPVPSSAQACDQYWTQKRGNPSILLWCQIESIRAHSPKHFSVTSVCSDPNCSQKPTAEGQEAVKSNNESIKQSINQSLNHSISQSGTAVLESVWGLSHTPGLWSLPEITVALGKHTHRNTQQHTLTDGHAESPPRPYALSPCCDSMWQIPDTIQQIKGRW